MNLIQLWIDGLENHYWQETGLLRRWSTDSQICGYGYCALGVLCDLFIKNAPEAKEMKARWEQHHFVWEDQGQEKKEDQWMPAPVLAWWKKHHVLDLAGIIAFNEQPYHSFRELALYLRGLAGMTYLTAR